MQAQMVQDEQKYVPVALRSHTILGVCEALGEDFGFNPVWLRVPLAASVLISPMMAIGAYFVLGGVVLLSRLLYPKSVASQADTKVDRPDAANEQAELAKAA